MTTVVNKIERLKSAQTVKDLPAFQLGSEPTEEEWDFFSLKKEYEYMGVPNSEWKLTVTTYNDLSNILKYFQDLNKDFGLCSTYDQVLSVPALAPDSIVKGSAQFRSRQRLPVLTYLHNNAAAIVRCAQPMAGANNRSAEGKKHLAQVDYYLLI